MSTTFLDALNALTWQQQLFLAIALVTAFAFEFINGFHDTANAVTTVIYTRTLKPTPAVLYSGFLNFLGVILGGTALAFAIVNLLPVDLLIDGQASSSLVMVLSLLLSGVIWNLGTWWLGLPVSSSHTLIGSILGVGLANSLMSRGNLQGVSWHKATEIGMSLLISPLVGFIAAGLLLLTMKMFLKSPSLYLPPAEGDKPPVWVRGILLLTCGGVSFAHGSNDGQKGMGLILLVLVGLMPGYYALNVHQTSMVSDLQASLTELREIVKHSEEPAKVESHIEDLSRLLLDKNTLAEIPVDERWQVRQAIFHLRSDLKQLNLPAEQRGLAGVQMKTLSRSIEYVPLWVVIGVALALGIGTTIGYKRIVVTVAEKIGKTHLTYAQGAAAETIAAVTISAADLLHLPVSTTHVLSSGIAGTMWANNSGIQSATLKKIGIAWVCTLPVTMLLAGVLFAIGQLFV